MKLAGLTVATIVLASTASAALAQGGGEALFKQRCGVCHSLAPSPAKMGPSLKGVVGRKSGAAPGFAYSPAMRKANLTWTAATLDRFLAGPGKLVPGTRMMVAVPSTEQRRAIVGYLAAQK